MTRLTHEPNPFIAQHPHPHVPIQPLEFPSAQSSEKSSHRIFAYGQKQTFSGLPEQDRFVPETGLQELDVRFGFDQVGSLSNSGLNWLYAETSGFDPETSFDWKDGNDAARGRSIVRILLPVRGGPIIHKTFRNVRD